MTYSIHVTRGFHVRRPLACWSRLRFQQYSSTARVPRYLEPDLMARACTSNRKGRLHERNMRLGLHVRSQSPHSLLSLAPYLSRASRTLRYMQSSSTKLRKAQPQPRTRSSIPIHWFFRTNIPRRRTSFLPADMQRRNFFGLGEIVGVLTNVWLSSLAVNESANRS
jgi:hypothetical protein